MVVLQEQCATEEEGRVTEKQFRSSSILDFSLSGQPCQRSLRTRGLKLKAPSANEPFYAITVFRSDTSYKVLHHVGQQVLSESVSSPKMKGQEILCDSTATDSRTEKHLGLSGFHCDPSELSEGL